MMGFLIGYGYIYLFCSICGWIFEVFFRRIAHGHWINPGFLSGPYLPIYGFASVILYYISTFEMDLWLRVLVFFAVTTGMELITGLIFLKIFHVRLWDYSMLRINFMGILSPVFSLMWLGFSMLFYYFVFPLLNGNLENIFNNLQYSFFIGMVAGVMLLDTINSYGIMRKVRKAVKEISDSKPFVAFDELKIQVRKSMNKSTGFGSIISIPFKGIHTLGEVLHKIIYKD